MGMVYYPIGLSGISNTDPEVDGMLHIQNPLFSNEYFKVTVLCAQMIQQRMLTTCSSHVPLQPVVGMPLIFVGILRSRFINV